MIINIPFSPSRLDSTEFMDSFLKEYFSGRKIVSIADIGCGKMFLYNILKNYPIKGTYLGIDINTFSPKEKIKSLKTRILQKDFLTYPISQKFDLVTCLWVLEHIKDDQKAFDKLSRLVKENGTLIIAVPSIYSWAIEFGRHGFHYYSKSRICKWADENDLKIERIYESAGLLGLVFMLIYSWPRLLFLPLLVVVFLILSKLGFEKRNWKKFSSDIVGKVFYSYHRNQKLLKIHNTIVSSIVFLDNKFKIFPASYIFILRK